MPDEKGIFTQQEQDEQFSFSYSLAKWLSDLFDKKSVKIDVGCGRGRYLAHLQDTGHKNLYGIEGNELSNKEFDNIYVQDVTVPFNFGERGHVICLEVAEHIPQEFLEVFVSNVCGLVLPDHLLVLSWAIPGQAGLGHVSCSHNFTVIEILRHRGFSFLPTETLEARNVIEDHQCDWFRNTIMVFKNNNA